MNYRARIALLLRKPIRDFKGSVKFRHDSCFIEIRLQNLCLTVSKDIKIEDFVMKSYPANN